MGTYFVSAQVLLNEYKYVIVPKKFDGFKKENQYQTSTYIKHFLTERGFNPVYEDALPDELNNNRCLGLLVGLRDDSNMFTTKTTIVLKDCSSKEVFVSKEGISKKKDYEQAYREALQDAFGSFDGISYAYTPKQPSGEPVILGFKDDVKKLEAPREEAPVSQPSPIITQIATPEEQSYKNREPIASNFQKAQVGIQVNPMPSPSEPSSIWYAQEMPYGYQLVDNTPKVRMHMYKSSIANVFMAKKDDKTGLLYANEDKWVFEYYEGETLRMEEVRIKF